MKEGVAHEQLRRELSGKEFKIGLAYLERSMLKVSRRIEKMPTFC